MNIDSLSRLIGSADVATQRQIAVHLLPLLGFDDSTFSDGPYDGGLDFFVRTQRVNGLKIGFQLSVESKWKQKITADAAKAKRVHGVNALYFISSKRIPGASFAPVRSEVAKATGLNLFSVDNQAIATEFIRANKVASLLQCFGIDLPEDERDEELLIPQNEAVASLLVFGSDARDFRDGMIDSTIKAVLARQGELLRSDLIPHVLSSAGLKEDQGVSVNSGIDRLLQSEQIVSREKKISLVDSERSIFEGLQAASAFELSVLRSEVEAYLQAHRLMPASEGELVLSNLLELTAALVSENLHVAGAEQRRSQVFEVTKSTLSNVVGDAETLSVFSELAKIVAESQFGKRMASARLYQILLGLNSRTLMAALGGNRGLQAYLDTSVFVPMICGVLFEPGADRFGKSGSDLFALMREHQFDVVLPGWYLEETAAHLVNACRNYRHILTEGIDISRSTNAFVSHYSSLRRSLINSELTFDDYVAVFGIKLGSLPNELSDADFFRARDRAAAEIRRIAMKYGVRVGGCDSPYWWRVRDRIHERLGSTVASRAPNLIEHDSKVAAFLEDHAGDSDEVQVLCTWDRIHAEINPDGASGYFVMSPVAFIDFLAAGARGAEAVGVASMSSFIDAINESQVRMSAAIWDVIAKINGNELSDAVMISKARQFREDYLTKHASLGLMNEDDVARSWIAWRNAKPKV